MKKGTHRGAKPLCGIRTLTPKTLQTQKEFDPEAQVGKANEVGLENIPGKSRSLEEKSAEMSLRTYFKVLTRDGTGGVISAQ